MLPILLTERETLRERDTERATERDRECTFNLLHDTDWTYSSHCVYRLDAQITAQTAQWKRTHTKGLAQPNSSGSEFIKKSSERERVSVLVRAQLPI